MPYVIAIVVLLVGAVAFFALRSPAEAPTTLEPNTQEITVPQNTQDSEESDDEEDEEAEPETGFDTELEVSSEVEFEPTPTPSTQDVDPVDNKQTLTAVASYFTPKRTEHDIGVSLTLEDNIVVGSEVTYDGGGAITPSHSAFDATYESEVIGKQLSEINLSRVGGASLTSEAFNDAVADIRVQS